MEFWAKLAVDYDEDEVVEAIAEEHDPTAVFALWPWLIAKCQKASHHKDNPDGWSRKISLRKVGAKLGASCASLEIWKAFIDGELIQIEGRLSGQFRVRLTRYDKHQAPLGSNKYHQRDHRTREQGKPASLSGPRKDPVRGESGAGHLEEKRGEEIPNAARDASTGEHDPQQPSYEAMLDLAAEMVGDLFAGVDTARRYLEQMAATGGRTAAELLAGCEDLAAQSADPAAERIRNPKVVLVHILDRHRRQKHGVDKPAGPPPEVVEQYKNLPPIPEEWLR